MFDPAPHLPAVRTIGGAPDADVLIAVHHDAGGVAPQPGEPDVRDADDRRIPGPLHRNLQREGDIVLTVLDRRDDDLDVAIFFRHAAERVLIVCGRFVSTVHIEGSGHHGIAHRLRKLLLQVSLRRLCRRFGLCEYRETDEG